MQQSYCSKATAAKLLQQSYCSKATAAKLLQHSYCSKATAAKLLQQSYAGKVYKEEIAIRFSLLVLRQLCCGSRRANLGMPGDLVIQERLVALK